VQFANGFARVVQDWTVFYDDFSRTKVFDKVVVLHGFPQ